MKTNQAQNSEDPPRKDTTNTQEALKLMRTLHYDPEGRQATNAYFEALQRNGHDSLATEGRLIIRNIIAGKEERMALHDWLHRLNTNTGDRVARKKVTVTTQNLGPAGIFRAMHMLEETLAMGPFVSCYQDVLIHGQDIRSVKRAIGNINPDYQVFSDTGSFAPDDFRKINYAGWGASDLAILTLLNKRIFDIPNCKIHDWRNSKERTRRLGRGRILWIKARTLAGTTINVVNVYQATADKPDVQKRIYEALVRALSIEHDPCILIGDFNGSIKGGRTNYARPGPLNPTSVADEALADFVEKTKGKILPPAQASWRNPFGGIRSREAKLDFAIIYNFEEAEVEGYVDWTSILHDHARIGFAIGDSLWENTQYTPKPTPKPCNSSKGKRFKIAQMLPVVEEVNDECAPVAESILQDLNAPTRQGVLSLLAARQEAFRKRLKVSSPKNAVLKLPMHRNAEQRELIMHIGSLQYALDKPTFQDRISLAARESFHIMDVSEELPLPDDLMLETVKGDLWRQTVESHLSWKKQLLEDITTKQIRANRWKDIKQAEKEFKEANGPANFATDNGPTRVLEDIHQDAVIGFYIHDLINSNNCPHPWERERRIFSAPEVSITITVSSQNQAQEGWKRITEVRTTSLILLRDVLQESTEWTELNILERGLLRDSGPWQDTNRDAVLEQGYEAKGLSHLSSCPHCSHKQATIISGVRTRGVPHASPALEIDSTQERYLDCFCSQCWSFQNFRHNKTEVSDWSFLAEALKDCKIKDPKRLERALRVPSKTPKCGRLRTTTSRTTKHRDRTRSKRNSSKRCHWNN
jgi:hypothetical protein